MATTASAFLDAPVSAGSFLDEESAGSGPSPYSPEGIAASRQAVVQARAAVAAMRAEQAEPQYRIGLRVPFIDEPVISAPIPALIAAFGAEAVKGLVPTGAGLAAASAVTPASRAVGTALRATPGAGRLAAPLVEFGVPLVAGGIAGFGSRLAEDQVLPQILPDAAAESYRLTAQLAAENPAAAMLGQFAGAAPFFRPGLPTGTPAGSRLTVPLITGGIGAGIEGAQQIAEGEFDPTRLAVAGFGSALLNRETGLGRTVAPNLVPKSTQILAEPKTKTPSIANVATEVATQTENSPYALQTQLNNMTTDQRRRVQQLQLEETFAGLPPKSAEESAAVFREPENSPLRVMTETPPAELQAITQARENVGAETAGAGQAGATIAELEARQAGSAMMGVGAERPLAPVEYVGIQEGLPASGNRPALPDIELFNLTEDIPGHPAGSTVSRDTLEAAGFEVPSARELSQPTGGIENAGQIESTTALGEQPVGPQGAGRVGGEGVEPGNQGQASAGDFLRESPVQEPRSLTNERGSVSPSLVAPVGGGAAGAVTGAALTDRQPGESEEEFQARRLRNAAIGAAAGAGLGALAIGAINRRSIETPAAAPKKLRGTKVDLPEAGEGQNIRRTAEKVIENKEYPQRLRETLADDPDILYDKFALNDLADRVRGADMETLQKMASSANLRERLGAIAELGNRYSVNGQPELAAEMYSTLSQHMTNPAQLLGLGKLVRSPQAMVDAVNDSLKGVNRKLSAPQNSELLKLATDKIKTEQAMDAAERIAERDFSVANEQAWKKAQREHAAAAKAMDEYVHQVAPESWGTIVSKIIQGNLLTPLSLGNNVFGNIVFQPVRRGAASIASAIDTIYSQVANKPRSIARANPAPGVAELEAAGDGIKVAAHELIHGPSADSYIKSEVQRGFRPLRSLASAFSGKGMAVREDGTVSLNDRAKKFVEGTLGIAPETMFRFLNLGDKPFRRAAQAEILMEQARIKGLKGRDLQKFMDFPDKKTQELLDTEGRRAIFAQENKGVQKLNQFLDRGLAEMIGADKIPALKEAIKVFGRLTIPFRQFPVNYVTTALSFVAPEVGMAKALFYGSRGNRRRALTSIGEAVMGAMMYGAANYLWDKGLISEPTDKDPKRRSVQYDQMGPQRLNISGLERSLSGGDPKWQSGDATVDWGKLGIPSAVFYVYTKGGAREKAAASKTGVPEIPDKSPLGRGTDRLGDYLQMAPWALDQSMLSGTAALLEAIKEAPDAGPLHAWARNTFRAVTSIAVPNSIEALARAEYKYIPDLKGETLGETLENTWDYKTLQLPAGDRALLKRDMWGDPIARTPEGKNPYIHQFVDVTGSAAKTLPDWKKPLLDLYRETDSPEVYPTPPARNITAKGVTVQLDPEDYQLLQQVVGAYRKRGVQILTENPKFQQAQTPEQKIYLLDKMYGQAANAGKELLFRKPGFVQRYFPELTGAGIPSEDESRVVERNLPARARVRVMEESK